MSVSLKEYVKAYILRMEKELDRRFTQQRELLEAKIASVEKSAVEALAASNLATTKSETSYDKRFHEANDLKQTILSLSSQMATHTEVDDAFQRGMDKIEGPLGLNLRIEKLTSRVDKFTAEAEGTNHAVNAALNQRNWAIGLSVAIILGILTILYKR